MIIISLAGTCPAVFKNLNHHLGKKKKKRNLNSHKRTHSLRHNVKLIVIQSLSTPFSFPFHPLDQIFCFSCRMMCFYSTIRVHRLRLEETKHSIFTRLAGCSPFQALKIIEEQTRFSFFVFILLLLSSVAVLWPTLTQKSHELVNSGGLSVLSES